MKTGANTDVILLEVLRICFLFLRSGSLLHLHLTGLLFKCYCLILLIKSQNAISYIYFIKRIDMMAAQIYIYACVCVFQPLQNFPENLTNNCSWKPFTYS